MNTVMKPGDYILKSDIKDKETLDAIREAHYKKFTPCPTLYFQEVGLWGSDGMAHGDALVVDSSGALVWSFKQTTTPSKRFTPDQLIFDMRVQPWAICVSSFAKAEAVAKWLGNRGVFISQPITTRSFTWYSNVLNNDPAGDIVCEFDKKPWGVPEIVLDFELIVKSAKFPLIVKKKEVIVIGGVEYDKEEVENALKNLVPLKKDV